MATVDFETAIVFLSNDKRRKEFNERCVAFEKAMQPTPKTK
jgi:hypothetical protein